MNKYIENNMNLEKFNSSNILEKDSINKDEASLNANNAKLKIFYNVKLIPHQRKNKNYSKILAHMSNQGHIHIWRFLTELSRKQIPL